MTLLKLSLNEVLNKSFFMRFYHAWGPNRGLNWGPKWGPNYNHNDLSPIWGPSWGTKVLTEVLTDWGSTDSIFNYAFLHTGQPFLSPFWQFLFAKLVPWVCLLCFFSSLAIVNSWKKLRASIRGCACGYIPPSMCGRAKMGRWCLSNVCDMVV